MDVDGGGDCCTDRVISADLMEGFELCRCTRQGHRICYCRGVGLSEVLK